MRGEVGQNKFNIELVKESKWVYIVISNKFTLVQSPAGMLCPILWLKASSQRRFDVSVGPLLSDLGMGQLWLTGYLL